MGGRAVTPDKTREYERRVGMLALQAVCRLPGGRASWPTDAGYRMTARVRESDRRVRDLSNILKAIEDGAEGVLWANDCQIHALTVERIGHGPPRVEVEVETMGDPR
jgi:Holliday junction resolvase RusA-like endonuclease